QAGKNAFLDWVLYRGACDRWARRTGAPVPKTRPRKHMRITAPSPKAKAAEQEKRSQATPSLFPQFAPVNPSPLLRRHQPGEAFGSAAHPAAFHPIFRRFSGPEPEHLRSNRSNPELFGPCPPPPFPDQKYVNVRRKILNEQPVVTATGSRTVGAR